MVDDYNNNIIYIYIYIYIHLYIYSIRKVVSMYG
jgi:hypothetical protein